MDSIAGWGGINLSMLPGTTDKNVINTGVGGMKIYWSSSKAPVSQ